MPFCDSLFLCIYYCKTPDILHKVYINKCMSHKVYIHKVYIHKCMPNTDFEIYYFEL